MKPKEKALELYKRYEQLGRDFTRGVSMKEFAKQCALTALDEISEHCYQAMKPFWKEVRQEVGKL
jgi:hypothetical protein